MHDQVLGDQVVVSAVAVFVLQWLKKTPLLPFVHAQSDKLNRFLAVLLSGAAAVGIHAQYDKVTGVLTITGLTLAAVGHGLWSWFQSFAVQEMVYRGVVKPNDHP